GVSAQFYDDFSVEMVEDDDVEMGFTEITDGPLPCNGYPEFRKLPLNQAFYLGAHNAGSHVFDKPCQGSQTQDISQMLEDGIRYLDINLCKDRGKVVICSEFDSTPSSLYFTDVLESIFTFSRDNVEQILILNLKSQNVDQAVETKDLEDLIDERCKVHTELTPGTSEFVKKECPFVEVFVAGKNRWPSLGKVVNYDPEMSQWVGDGEVVGVRTKLHISIADSIVSTPNYKTSYFSPAFWRSIHKDNKVESLADFKKTLGQLCRVPAGGIGLEAYVSDSCSAELNQGIANPSFIEDTLVSRSGCNLNDSPLNTFISFISMDNYELELPYLKELEARMMDLNFEKWSGNYKPIQPSKLLKEKKEITRDEL
ncbi:hypothetical protein INT47_013145, partial [Mucor saturninus]